MSCVKIPTEHLLDQGSIRINDTHPFYDKLKKSIKRIGLRDPLEVVEIGKDQYIIVDGIFRYRACVELGHKTIHCYVRRKQ